MYLLMDYPITLSLSSLADTRMLKLIEEKETAIDDRGKNKKQERRRIKKKSSASGECIGWRKKIIVQLYIIFDVSNIIDDTSSNPL